MTYIGDVDNVPRRKWQEAGNISLIMTTIICTLHHTLLAWSHRGWNGQGM